jgi:hypothetical protein
MDSRCARNPAFSFWRARRIRPRQSGGVPRRRQTLFLVQVSRFAAAWFAALIHGSLQQPRAGLLPPDALRTDMAWWSRHSGLQTTFLLFVWKGPTRDHSASKAHALILLLYDCDTNRNADRRGRLFVRSIPRNSENSKAIKGVENLLPSDLLEERFYRTQKVLTDYGGENMICDFLKAEFCAWICQERREPKDFQHFNTLLLPIFREFLTSVNPAMTSVTPACPATGETG